VVALERAVAPRTIERQPVSDRTRALASLRALIAALSRSARAIESRTGLTNAQLFLLRQIAAHQDISINELSTLAHTRQNTVSSLVGRLVRHGVIRKGRSAADARRASVSLTRQGARLLAKAPVSPTESLITGLEALSRADARALARGLAALIANLGVDVQTAPLLFEDEPQH
jgi:DNA-binding MarR family transcriptional regulator